MKIIKKYKYLISITILIVVSILCFVSKKELKENNVVVSNNIYRIETNNIEEEKIMVDIKGAIVNPGVYELESSSRINDLIKVAGGLKDNANTSLINLSKKLSDEMVVIIYTNEEVKNSNVKEIETVFKIVEKECNCPNIKNDACVNTELDNKSSDIIVDSSNGLVNINTASLTELISLEGIGESKAKAIIDYREINGNFKETKDIMNVSGIGEAVFNSIKEFITT